MFTPSVLLARVGQFLLQLKGQYWLQLYTFDKKYYLDLILKALDEHKNLARKDIDELLWKKLPEWMSDKQKKSKINNLISELRRGAKVRNTGSDKAPNWVKSE